MVIGSLTPPPIFDLQWSPSPLWWVFGSVLTKELKKPQEEEAPLTSPLWKWKSRQHGLKYQEFRTSLHSPPAPARWSWVESIAISLFGNMTVEPREIHIQHGINKSNFFKWSLDLWPIENYEFGGSISRVLFHHISQISTQSVCVIYSTFAAFCSAMGWFESFYVVYKW